MSVLGAASEEDPAAFSLQMEVAVSRKQDAGPYYCSANNSLGTARLAVRMRAVNCSVLCRAVTRVAVVPRRTRLDVGSCCAQRNVSAQCSGICQVPCCVLQLCTVQYVTVRC